MGYALALLGRVVESATPAAACTHQLGFSLGPWDDDMHDIAAVYLEPAPVAQVSSASCRAVIDACILASFSPANQLDPHLLAERGTSQVAVGDCGGSLADDCSRSFQGSSNEIVVPCSAPADVAQMRPPWASTMPRQRYSPSPRPSVS